MDGAGVGNGDDLCLDHPNRVYVRVKNIGDGRAQRLRLHVRAQLFPGLNLPGISTILGSIDERPLFAPAEIGTATRNILDPGESADMFVEWNLAAPPGTPPFARIQIPFAAGANFDAVANEVATNNQAAGEAISYVEAVPSRFRGTVTLGGFIGIANRFKEPSARTFTLDAPTGLGKGTRITIGANNRRDLSLKSGRVRRLPIRITLPKAGPIGQPPLCHGQAGHSHAADQPGNPALVTGTPHAQRLHDSRRHRDRNRPRRGKLAHHRSDAIGSVDQGERTAHPTHPNVAHHRRRRCSRPPKPHHYNRATGRYTSTSPMSAG